MRISKILPCIVLCFFFSSAYAAEDFNPKVTIESFLSRLVNGKVNEAYDKILEGSLLKQKSQDIEYLKTQTSTAINFFGKILGFEFVNQEEYGNSVIKFVYLLKCGQLPLAWEFYFYKPEEKWLLINIRFKDDIKEILSK